MSLPSIVLAGAACMLLFSFFVLPYGSLFGVNLTMWDAFRMVRRTAGAAELPIALAVTGGPLIAGLGMLAIFLFSLAARTDVKYRAALVALVLAVLAGAPPALQVVNGTGGPVGVWVSLAACVTAAGAALILFLPRAEPRVGRGDAGATTGGPPPIPSADHGQPAAAAPTHGPDRWETNVQTLVLEGVRAAETIARDFDARYVGALLSGRLRSRRTALIVAGVFGITVAAVGGYAASGDATAIMILAVLPPAAVLLLPFRICAPKEPTP